MYFGTLYSFHTSMRLAKERPGDAAIITASIRECISIHVHTLYDNWPLPYVRPVTIDLLAFLTPNILDHQSLSHHTSWTELPALLPLLAQNS